MAKKAFKELQKLSKDELSKKVRDAQLSLFQGKMKLATGQLENTSSLWVLRKTITRAQALLSKVSAQK